MLSWIFVHCEYNHYALYLMGENPQLSLVSTLLNSFRDDSQRFYSFLIFYFETDANREVN